MNDCKAACALTVSLFGAIFCAALVAVLSYVFEWNVPSWAILSIFFVVFSPVFIAFIISDYVESKGDSYS